MKRYEDCFNEHSQCSGCSLSSYGMDCHNHPVNPLAYRRKLSGMTQQALAIATAELLEQMPEGWRDKGRVNHRYIQDLEQGQRDLRGAGALRVYLLATALGCGMEDLLF